MQIRISNGQIVHSIEHFKQVLGDNLLLIDYKLVLQDPITALNAIETFSGIERYFDQETFQNVRINASDQLRHGLINRLMHQRWFADTITRVVPKKAIMAVRLRVQGGKEKRGSVLDSDTEKHLVDTSRVELSNDIQYYESVFEKGPIVFGSGNLFA